MIGNLGVLRAALFVLGCFTLLAFPARAHAECIEGNVLGQAAVSSYRGVIQPGALVDGWVAPDGSPNGVPDAVIFRNSRAEIVWEFNEPTTVNSLDIQADHNDIYTILGSLDGNTWKTLWEVPLAESSGLRSRSRRGMSELVRFIKLRASGGDGAYSVSELRVFCRAPAQWSVGRYVRLPKIESPHSTETFNAFSWKIVLALSGLFFIFVVTPRVPERFREPILICIIGLSAFGWTHFGQFQGHAKGKGMLHEMDMLHYYVGSKYYRELGYQELYRCVAKYERERGNADRYRAILIRDLDDNRLYPFSWTATPEGRCRTQFSSERWKQFGEDLEAFRPRQVTPPMEHLLGDHGFNATPVHATWLSALTNLTSPSDTTLRVLAQIDSMALLGAVLSLAWGFDLSVAAVAALLIQVGGPWSYNWIGGGLGRHVWFAFSCWGVALLKQNCVGRGVAALTVAALLRLFPAVFLGGLGVYFASEWIRQRVLSESARRALFGLGLTLVIGFGMVAASQGLQPFGRFYDKISHHAAAPAGNRMGFPHLISLGPGKMSGDLIDNRLSDPVAPWRETVHISQKERRPLGYLAIVASLGVLGWVVWRIRTPWVSALAAGPLLYSVQDMTSYDYMWLVLLVPVGFVRRRALTWLCGFAVFTQIMMITFPNFEHRHWFYAVALFPTMIVVALELIEWGRSRDTPSRDPLLNVLQNEKTPG